MFSGSLFLVIWKSVLPVSRMDSPVMHLCTRLNGIESFFDNTSFVTETILAAYLESVSQRRWSGINALEDFSDRRSKCRPASSLGEQRRLMGMLTAIRFDKEKELRGQDECVVMLNVLRTAPPFTSGKVRAARRARSESEISLSRC